MKEQKRVCVVCEVRRFYNALELIVPPNWSGEDILKWANKHDWNEDRENDMADRSNNPFGVCSEAYEFTLADGNDESPLDYDLTNEEKVDPGIFITNSIGG